MAYEYAAETLHIALMALSQKQPVSQTETLVTSLYQSYRNDMKKYSVDNEYPNPTLYNPLKYYIFGNYDVALISLVNNYKFLQKQLTPKINETDEFLAEPYSFQIITGSCPLINKEFDIYSFFKQKQDKPDDFICISNLKLNNKLLIGNGNVFLAEVLKLVDKRIKAVLGIRDQTPQNYFLQQTYSWFEISVIHFTNRIEDVSMVLSALRHLSLNDLFDDPLNLSEKKSLLAHSVYEDLVVSEEDIRSFNPHLFADTHSYFGIHFSQLEKNAGAFRGVKLKTQIEWELKPGHFSDLLKYLDSVKLKNSSVFEHANFILTGKTDIFVQEKSDDLVNNILLLKHIQKDPTIFKFVRRLKTKVFLEHNEQIKTDNVHPDPHPDFMHKLRNLTDGYGASLQINKQLKKLKISRNVRNKVNKIYFNYNNGIQDPILFTYFLDFTIFIRNLTRKIQEDHKIFENSFRHPSTGLANALKQVNILEAELIKPIDIFEEGYNIRMLNAHHYEDINDFDLDCNSSVQQILSCYNTLAAHLSQLYFEEGQHGPVVQIRLKNTVSNYDSINYDVYHLTSPEFVFFTLVKEILNKYIYSNHADKQLVKRGDGNGEENRSIREIIDDLHAEVEQSGLQEYLQAKMIDFEYYYLDAIKYIQTCNLDFELYMHWFWTYNFQNASLYDSIGTMDEQYFKNELIRLIFLAYLFDENVDLIKCPLPELYYLWERHFRVIVAKIAGFFQESQHVSLFKSSVLAIFQYPAAAKHPKYPVTKEVLDKERRLRARMATRNVYSDNIMTDIISQFRYTHYRSNEFKERLRTGQPVYCNMEEAKGFAFINAFLYSYLQLIFEQNGKQSHLLRRDWSSGEPLVTFLRSQHANFLYSVDPWGGIFFGSQAHSATYFKLRNAVMQSLWHFSLLSKKSLFFKALQLS